jgi:hypothetical protein
MHRRLAGGNLVFTLNLLALNVAASITVTTPPASMTDNPSPFRCRAMYKLIRTPGPRSRTRSIRVTDPGCAKLSAPMQDDQTLRLPFA